MKQVSETFKSLFQSKRFVAFAISIVIFLILALTTTFGVMEVAGALSLISGIYIGGESYRPSDPVKKENVG